MSDIDDYFSGDDSDENSVSSVEETPIPKTDKKITTLPNIKLIEENEDLEEEEDDVNAYNEDEMPFDYENEDINIGGGKEYDSDSGNEYENEENIQMSENKKQSKLDLNVNLKGLENNYDTDDKEDDESEDENYLQKFDSDINKNYIVDFHPECLIHNYDEISIFTSVTRDNDNIIIDELHRTIPYLTK